MKALYLLVVSLFITLSMQASGTDVLSQSDKNKIAKNSSHVDEGNIYIKESDDYLLRIKQLSSTGSAFSKDSSKLVHKSQRSRLVAFDYLDDGYKGLYTTYLKAVVEANLVAGISKVDDLVQASKISHKNGRKFLKMVPDEMDKHEAVKLLDMGVDYEKSAIARLKDAIDVLNGGAGRSDKTALVAAPVLQASVLKTDSLTAKPQLAVVTAVAIPVARIDSSSLVSSAVLSVDNATTFFTIQINASKTRLTTDQISFYYRGSYLVVLMEGDGYYRYSVGKFMSLADAQSVIDKESIKGYIVGYIANKRSPIADVAKALTINK